MARLLSILALVVLSGCATNIQTRQDATSGPDESLGYLAGGFINSYRESFARMALEVHNVDNSEAVLIELQQPKNAVPLELFPLQPGTYKISNLVEMTGIGEVGGRIPIEHDDLSVPFKVAAQTVTYIGHYDGQSTNKVTSVTFTGTVGWADTNSGYAFQMVNQPLDEVKVLITDQYPAFGNLVITSAFALESADQEGRR